MRRLAMFLGFGILGIALTVGVGASQEGKKEAGKAKMNMLPPGWKALNLTAEQKQKVYDIQNKYRTKIDALEDQIAKLRDEMSAERARVLTDAQKATLRKTAVGDDLAAPEKKAGK